MENKSLVLLTNGTIRDDYHTTDPFLGYNPKS